ncbi:porin [Marinicauda salina]|nr:porin [Marinicauda salina]
MRPARDAIFTAVACALLAAAPTFSQDLSSITNSSSTGSGVERIGPFSPDVSLAVDALAAAGDVDAAETGPYADLDLDLELEAVTRGGLRWGAAFGVRARRGDGRRGFARPVGDCPVTVAGCPAIGGRTPAGAATGLHAAPVLDAGDPRIALDEAAAFVKGGWGEIRIGRGPGAAALEAAPGPGAFRLARADGPLIDATGLALADTTDRLSGAAAKITARTRRLAGFRASASWTPEADWCGVDVCRLDGRDAVATPAVENVREVGVSFDRRFRSSGRRWTLSAGYAAGEVAGPLASAFADPWSVSARASLEAGPAAIGVSWLKTNDGFEDGDYEAWAASASIERGAWLAALEFAAGDSDFLDAEGWSVQLGASRLFESGLLLGVGLARAEQTAPVAGPGGIVGADADAVIGFVETGWRF